MIRSIKDIDVKRVLEIYSPYVLNTTISFEITVPTYDEFFLRVSNIRKNYPYLVYEMDGQVVGYAYASRFRERKAYDSAVELSVYVDDNYKKKGIGASLLEKLLEELKCTNVSVAISCICYPNIASEKLHEKLGFKKCGHIHNVGVKFNNSLDIVFYEKMINEGALEFIPYSIAKNGTSI